MRLLPSSPESLESSWNEVAKKGAKLQRRAIRFFSPHLIARGRHPSAVTDQDLDDICDGLPVDAAKLFFAQKNLQNVWARNSFVRAFRAIEEAHAIGLPALTETPSKFADGLAQKADFCARHKAELAQFFSTYRLPSTYRIETAEGRQVPKFDDPRLAISDKYRDDLTHALCTGWRILRDAGYDLPTLADLHAPAVLERLEPLARADSRSGMMVQMLRAISQLASENEDYAAVDNLNRIANRIQSGTELGVSGEQLSRMRPYADDSTFASLGRALVGCARLSSPQHLRTKRGLISATSATGALVAILTPATFEVINSASYKGPSDQQRTRPRPTLYSDQHGDLEAHLNPQVRDLLDGIYFGFLTAYGQPPAALLCGQDGFCRKYAASSVNGLLEKLGAELNASELRDLGVYRLALKKESIDKMANASRLSRKWFLQRYRLMLDSISEGDTL